VAKCLLPQNKEGNIVLMLVKLGIIVEKNLVSFS